MKSFEWANPGSVDEAVKLLAVDPADHGDPDEAPRPLAGGQDLLTTMKDYITRPSRVVNLKTIRAGAGGGLAGIEVVAGGLKIGALTTLTALEEHPEVIKSYPGLAEAAHSIASPQIRNVGTVGGNLCQRPRCWYFRLEHYKCLKRGGTQCYAATGENKYNAILGGGPSYIVHPSDLAPMLMALDATVTIAGPAAAGAAPSGATASRDLALSEFFTLPANGNLRRENVLQQNEIVTAVHVPVSALAARSTYLKFKERQSLDFALASVAAALELGADNTVKQARIVLGGVAPIPWRAPKAETFLLGKKPDAATIAQAAKLALEGAQPLDQNAYKVPLTQTLVRRALAKLAG